MGKKLKEYQKTIASTYLLLILAVLPLYMRDGLNAIGDAKYLFYRNVSLLFLTLWIIGMIVSLGLQRRILRGNSGNTAPQAFRGAGRHKSYTDIFAVCFAIVSLFSYLFSDYKDTAFWGYSGWYMGLIVQILLVWGYFFISRCYEQDRFVWRIVWLSAFAVCLLGILNRTGNDPINVYKEMSWWDWNRRNLLSTIGNINWYCSYLAVLLPLLLYSFWSGKGKYRLLAGVGAYVGLGAIMLQGSASGYLALFAMLMVLFLGSLKDVGKFLRFLEAVMLIPLFWFLMSVFQVDLILPYDMDIKGHMYTPLWGLALAAVLAVYLVIKMIYKRNGKDFLRSGRMFWTVFWLIAGAGILAAFILACCQLSDRFWELLGCPGILKFNDEWGNMRGGLWKMAWKGFGESSLVKKLYGVGPDCFACYFYEHYSMDIQMTGQWQEAVFANAHNEWLNMLINEGILGCVAYTGLFVSAFCRCLARYNRNQKLMAGMMSIAAYCVNNFFSFGQVVSTPLIFMVIAVCENECRRMETQKKYI